MFDNKTIKTINAYIKSQHEKGEKATRESVIAHLYPEKAGDKAFVENVKAVFPAMMSLGFLPGITTIKQLGFVPEGFVPQSKKQEQNSGKQAKIQDKLNKLREQTAALEAKLQK